jgi:hypothetical protein
MDGGIDLELSHMVFPNIELKVKSIVKSLNKLSLVGKYYLLIGSSIIVNNNENTNEPHDNKYLVVVFFYVFIK